MTIEELRRFVLGFDGAFESSHHGNADFRYRNRIVVNLHESERSITIKLPLDEQAALMGRGDGVFSLPGGWAKYGWTNIDLENVEDDELRELIAQAWSETQSRVR